MNSVTTRLVPSATKMIRMDHTHVLATFHKYRADAAPKTKQAIANSICIALEVHAQLEEEIFYPALQSIDSQVVAKSVPEHDDMRRMISALRNMEPGSAGYDDTLMQLMRTVIHHVADEETTLLPEAERGLGPDKLGELGAQMTKRRMELIKPKVGELARNMIRAMPASTMLVGAGALIASTYVIRNAIKR